MVYDLIIIGGSAAATSAGIYAARRGLNFKIITKEFGGEVATSGEVGNWPGEVNTNGFDLAKKFKAHLAANNVEIEEGVWVERVKKRDDGVFCISAKTGKEVKVGEKMQEEGDSSLVCTYEAKTVIITTGVHPKKLDVSGEKEYYGKGVTYCTVCDGPLFAGKTVAVIGGGNSALESGLMLADLCPKVYVININSKFAGEQLLINKLASKSHVEVIYGAKTKEILGEKFVTSLKYEKEGEKHELQVDGIFVHIGMVPNSGLLGDEVEKNKFGNIIVDKLCQTNVSGLYAAGDVTDLPYHQIVIAGGQGTTALLSAVDYLNKY